MKYFTIAELCQSEKAGKLAIDNRCKTEHVTRLTELVNKVLDPLREKYGKPIKVNSGFRCPALNKAVGGASTSQHMQGEAADITAGSIAENKILFALVQELGLPFDQLIDEKGYSWIHISYRASGNRKEVKHLK